MSPRRTILRELSRVQGNGLTRPNSIRGFAKRPAQYQAAVNALLQERLINGTKDDDGRLAISLNEHRIADVKRELRPWFARPVTWVAAFALIAIGLAAGVML